MKQFIVLAAVLPILMIFVMQLALEQENQGKAALMQEYVYAAKEEAKQAGGFTDEIKQKLRSRIADAYDIEPTDVIIEANKDIKYRKNKYDERGIIAYTVKAPVDKIMAGNKLLGISDDENSGWYEVSGHTASEKLPDSY